jgi:hypothetical protein
VVTSESCTGGAKYRKRPYVGLHHRSSGRVPRIFAASAELWRARVLRTEREGMQTEIGRDLLPQVSSLVLAMVGQPPPFASYGLAYSAGKLWDGGWQWLTGQSDYLCPWSPSADGGSVGLGCQRHLKYLWGGAENRSCLCRSEQAKNLGTRPPEESRRPWPQSNRAQSDIRWSEE